MKQILKKIIKKFSSHKGLVLLLALGCTLWPNIAGAITPEVSTGENSETIQNFAETLSVLISFLSTILWPLLLAIGDLMDVDMIIGPGMESRLLDIWVQVRNLVNIAFVLVLLVVAFYNVLGLGGGEGELAIKTALPKIVIGLVIVNFTYLGGRVVLDVVNVGTTVAFGLPQFLEEAAEEDGEGTSSGYSFKPEVEKFEEKICLKSTTAVDEDTGEETKAYTGYALKDAPIQTQIFCEYYETGGTDLLANGMILEVSSKSFGGLRDTLEQRYFQNLNKNNVALIMAVNMGNLGSQNLLKEGSVLNFKDLTVNLIFSTVMYLILALSYIVLAIILLVRVVVLWLALALSPVAVLTYVVPQIKEWMGGGGDFSQKVIKHLIAPIIIGFTLSMGFLLMSAWNQVADPVSSYSSSEVDGVIQNELLISGIDDLPKLILAIASIVVVWMGVFAAAEGTYAQGITDKIKDFGEKAKDFALNSAALAPILPISVNGESKQSMSPMALGKAVTSFLETADDRRLEKQLEQFKGTTFGKMAFGDGYNSENPEMNKINMQTLFNEISDTKALSVTEAERIAKHLYHIVGGNKEMDENRKTTIKEEIQKVQQLYNKKDGNLDNLRQVVTKHDLTAEELGMKESQYEMLMSTGSKGLKKDFVEKEESKPAGTSATKEKTTPAPEQNPPEPGTPPTPPTNPTSPTNP